MYTYSVIMLVMTWTAIFVAGITDYQKKYALQIVAERAFRQHDALKERQKASTALRNKWLDEMTIGHPPVLRKGLVDVLRKYGKAADGLETLEMKDAKSTGQKIILTVGTQAGIIKKRPAASISKSEDAIKKRPTASISKSEDIIKKRPAASMSESGDTHKKVVKKQKQ